MRLNGARHEGYYSNSSSKTDDMIETENETIRERVTDLEKKVLEQGDEIVCLRSTLADVLRRLNLLEGTRAVSKSSPSPVKNGVLRVGGSNHCPPKELRYRPLNEIANNKDNVRRVVSYTPSSLPQRRAVHYQSTGSLHSDSPSSSSVSPIPTSPTPSPTRPPSTVKSPSASVSMTNLHSAKRWSSTGDFHNASSHNYNSRLATKSLFNLHMRPQQTQNHSPVLKHGTRDTSYNEEEGSLRMYLRGRPIVFYAPTALSSGYEITKVATAPHQKLKLDWVYGYRGKDCRSNLYLLPTGEFVYFVAAVVVLYNINEQSQRHYLGHTDDVKCISIHPNRLYVASGQTSGHDTREGRPHIRIWNAVNLNTLVVLGIGEFERSVSCISFSKADGGSLLCAVDEANDHVISIWDWQKGDKGHKITETKCSVDTIIGAEFHPLDRNSLVTCGKSHIGFWTLDNGGTLFKRMGVFDNRDKPKYVTCLAFTQTGDVLSGDTNGNIIVWGRGTNTISRFVRGVHEGSVFSICLLKGGTIITGGGKDGRLVQFDSELQPTGFEAQIAEHVGGVRTISEGVGSQLLVGSTKNCILVGSLALGFSPAVLGHTDELWALATHPSLSQFLTAGFDRIVQLWDSMAHSVVWSKDISEHAQSAEFSPDGSVIIIGCVSGRWLVMDSETREVYSSHTDGNEPIQVIRYSPNGAILALGSRDNNIYIYHVDDSMRKYGRIGRCTGHSSFITHLDWSKESDILRSNSGDYELLFWNPRICRQIPQSISLRDVEWATQTCVLSFTTVGIWPEGADGTDINACVSSHSSNILATGDDFGKVKLYSYPVCQPKSLHHTYGGHSSHVTNVKFLHDDSRLISIGGKDTGVFQWSVIS